MSVTHPTAIDIYAENAQWRCRNLQTGQDILISGPLAQLLKKYPNDYALELLSVEGGPHEHLA